MRKADPSPLCSSTRSWFSAHRDAEALDDLPARAHLSACASCSAWAASLDVVTRRTAVRRVGSPDVTTAAIAAFQRQQAAAPQERQRTAARGLLAVAGLTGLVLAALGLTDTFGTLTVAGAHVGRELYAFEAALSVGFLLAAWRPGRYAASLLPITAVVILVAVLPSAGDLGRSGFHPLAEASHLPVLLGLVALLLHSDGSRGRRRTGLRSSTA